MGMSASQARLLSLTARMNDVEFKSQNIANIKIRLADESEQLAMKYTKALGQQKYTLTSYASGQAQKVDLTLNSLFQPNSRYQIKANNGKTVLSNELYNMFKTAVDVSNNPKAWANYGTKRQPSENPDLFNEFMAVKYGSVSELAERVFAATGKVYNWHDHEGDYLKIKEELGGYGGGFGTWQAIVNYAAEHDVKVAGLPTMDEVNYYESLYKQYTANCSVQDATCTRNPANPNTYIQLKESNLNDYMGIPANASNDPAWLYNAIESGEFILVDTQTGEEVTASSSVALAIETDNSNFAKAEAEYNAANMKINNKEKLLDNELKKLDTEHNALSTEMDSIKNLIGKNIEKSFNLFS